MRIFRRVVIVFACSWMIALAWPSLVSAQSSTGGKKGGASTSAGKAKQMTGTSASGGFHDPSLYAAGAIAPKKGGANPLGAPCRTNCGQ